MSYPFLKGHGTENDFVLLPDHDGSVHGDLSAARVRALCDRRAGLGADGVLRVIRTEARAGAPAEWTDSDPAPEWFMDYRNADGSLAEMCGNGIRVFARHLHEEGLAPADAPLRLATRAGVKTVTRDRDRYTADLGVATIHGETKVSVEGRTWPALHVDTGNPHAVVLVDDLADPGPESRGERRGGCARAARPRLTDPTLVHAHGDVAGPDGPNELDVGAVRRRGMQLGGLREVEVLEVDALREHDHGVRVAEIERQGRHWFPVPSTHHDVEAVTTGPGLVH